MRRTVAVTAFLALAVLPAHAAEGVELSLQSRHQAVSSAGIVMKHADAPFKLSRDPMPEILMHQELDSRGGPRAGCEVTTRDLCYDVRDGKIVYRRARDYMPRIGGLTPESISVKRSGVTFKYSF